VNTSYKQELPRRRSYWQIT